MTFNPFGRASGARHPGHRAIASAALFGVGVGLVLVQATGASAALPGDAFANPRIIARSTGADDLTDTTFFSAESGEPTHGARTPTRSAWYRWQSPVTGRVTFRTQDTDFDTVMSAYTGDSLTQLTSIGENDDTTFDDGTVRQSQLSFAATAGVTYRIAVDGFSSANLGQVVLSWDANDSFAGATPLSGPIGTQSVTSNNTGATKEPGEPQHAGSSGGHSVWFTWKAPASGAAVFSTGRGQVDDTLLAAYQGNAVGALTQVAANDDVVPEVGVSSISFAAVKGATYRVAVDGKRSDDPLGAPSPDQGAFPLSYSLTPTAGPTLSVADVSVTEGDTGQKPANLVVKLSKAATTQVSVTAATTDGTATKTSDFVGRSATVVIPAGSTSVAFPVQVLGDAVAEPQEKFGVSLSSATGGVTIGDATATVTVTDNDVPTLSVLDAAVTEGNAGTKNVTITVKAAKASAQQLSVRLATAGDTAKSGADFVAVSGREIVVAPGQTSATTTVAVVGDLAAELDETFKVMLTAPTGGAVVGDATGIVTITDNDIL